MGANDDGSKAILKAYNNPLVAWVWICGLTMVIGTLIALLPNRKSLPPRRKATAGLKEDDEAELAAPSPSGKGWPKAR